MRWNLQWIISLSGELHQLSGVTRLSAGRRHQEGGRRGVRVGGQPTGALMTWTHLGRLLNGHSRCSPAVYLLFSVTRPDFLQRMGRLLAVSVLLWEFVLHLEMHERRYDKHHPLRGPWPCWLLQLPWHQPHTEKSPTPQCRTDECLLSLDESAAIIFPLMLSAVCFTCNTCMYLKPYWLLCCDHL